MSSDLSRENALPAGRIECHELDIDVLLRGRCVAIRRERGLRRREAEPERMRIVRHCPYAQTDIDTRKHERPVRVSARAGARAEWTKTKSRVEQTNLGECKQLSAHPTLNPTPYTRVRTPDP
jgi:hypothetical protein